MHAALGETSVVKAWHLRPSLIWNGGEWIEWSSREDDQSHDKVMLLLSPFDFILQFFFVQEVCQGDYGFMDTP